MTREEYEKFAEALQENGYRNFWHSFTRGTDYWCKDFKEDGDIRPSYQVQYRILDSSLYALRPENNPFGVQTEVPIFGERRICLTIGLETETGNHINNIKENETMALSFYEWAKKNLEL